MKKRLLSLALASAMVFTMAMPAMAAEHTITITDSTTGNVKTSEHTMNAYQVFTGTIAAEGTEGHEETGSVTKLANIEWGSGVNSAALLKALKASTVTTSITKDGTAQTIGQVFADCTTAADVAEAMTKFSAAADIQNLCKIIEANVSTTFVTNNGGSTITVPTEGYYFIKDATATLPDGADAYSDYILQILDNKTIKIKTDASSITKKILDGSKEVDESSAQIGEVVRYQWTSKVPNTTNYEGFYYYYMEDSMDGLLFDQNSVSVWIDYDGDNQKDDNEVLSSDAYALYDVSVSEGSAATKDAAQVNASSSFKLAFKDMLTLGSTYETKTVDGKETQVLKYAGKNIYVDYSATLAENCTIGETGNPNTVKLDYSNKPSYDYNGTQITSKPGLPDSEKIEKNVIGVTPEDTVISYTTEVDLTKYVDKYNPDKLDENKELEGAEFTLTGTAYKTVVVSGTSFKEDNNGEYYKLNDGTYTKDAPVTEETVSMRELTADEKKTATDGYVKRADNDNTGDKQTDVEIGGVTYRVVNADEKPEYILSYVKANDDLYDSTTKKYSLVEGGTTEVKEAYEVSQTFTTGDDGKISFKGLDAGTYTLKETVVPDGYNVCDDITFTIKFNGEVVINSDTKEVSETTDKCDWSITANTDTETIKQFKEYELGKFATNIIDKSGTVLPTTGGIGTTIFYVLGSILVIGAGVLLVAKKRVAR